MPGGNGLRSPPAVFTILPDDVNDYGRTGSDPADIREARAGRSCQGTTPQAIRAPPPPSGSGTSE